MVLILAVLAVAGCDSGKPDKTPAAAPAPVAAVATGPQWDVEVVATEALTDITAWLLEHGYPFQIDAKRRILIGPFSSKADAEAKNQELAAKLINAHRAAGAQVVEHQ
ncbi:SPOR domain-containing protein [Pseudomonas sp. Pseusp122]|uniref:SPOR domain-containing protein n=1 Tax=unclassified Pseudomonas TaxID=196821 RepID=UPI0039A435B8